MMLTSSQWLGVLTFVSKQCTYVFVLTIDCTLVQCFVCGLSPSGKVASHELPYPSITAFEPPLPLGISNDLPWGGGGAWIFSGTTHCSPTFPQKGKNVFVFFFEFYFIVVVHRTVAYEGIYVNLSSLSLLREPSALKLKEIKGTQHMICMEKQRFYSCLSARVVHLGPPGSALPA